MKKTMMYALLIAGSFASAQIMADLTTSLQSFKSQLEKLTTSINNLQVKSGESLDELKKKIKSMSELEKLEAFGDAFRNDEMDKVKFLVKHIDVNYKDPDPDTDDTLLMEAVKNNELAIAELLIEEGADVNHQNKDGKTPLIRAAAYGNKEIADLLIKNGANLNASDLQNYTALMFAIEKDRPEIAKLLLEHNAEINTQNTSGWSPLILAAILDDKEMVKILVNKGANVDLKDKKGKKAIDYVTDEELKDLLKKASKE